VTRHYLDAARPGGPVPPVARAFETISLAKVSTSAAEARSLKYLREGDGITMNRGRLLADAKRKALELTPNYAPPEPEEIVLPGPSARLALDMVVDGLVAAGKATAHDRVVTGALAEIVSGGDTDLTETVTEKDMLALERAAFLNLIRMPATLRRMEHVLETGKPLRN
jgi:3-hydroxyacyl-CoA dehydrogenase